MRWDVWGGVGESDDLAIGWSDDLKGKILTAWAAAPHGYCLGLAWESSGMEMCKSFGILVGGGQAGRSAENSWLSGCWKLRSGIAIVCSIVRGAGPNIQRRGKSAPIADLNR